MEKQRFETLMSNLLGLIKKCEDLVGDFRPDAIRKWTVDEYIKKTAQGRDAMRQMDQIMSSEVYHIIGMGNLSMAQTAKFIQGIKKLGTYRSKIKTLNNFTVIGIPKMAAEAEYKSSLTKDTLIKEVK